MNVKRNILFVCVMGLSIEVYAHPIIKSFATGVVTGGFNFVGITIEQAAFKVDNLLTVGEAFQASAVVAAGTAIIAAPSYLGCDAISRADDARIIGVRDRRHINQEAVKKSLMDIATASDRELSDRKNNGHSNLSRDVYKMKRFEELCTEPLEHQRKCIKYELEPSTLSVESKMCALSLSTVLLLGFNCPKMAAGALAANYLTAGVVWMETTNQIQKIKDAQNQVFREISQETYKKDAKHSLKIDELIKEVKAKTQAIDADKNRRWNQRDGAIESMVSNIVYQIK